MSLSNKSLTHAYILRTGSVLSPAVQSLISEMLCSGEINRPCGECINCVKVARGIHPDVTIIAKPNDKKEIQVDQIREAVFGAHLLPNEAERRVIIVSNAEDMNINSQNALLKILEEPPAHIAILLITGEPGSLLPTVRSRCRIVEAGGGQHDVSDDIKNLADQYVELAFQGGEQLVEFSYELDKTDKQDFSLFLSEVRAFASRRMRQALEKSADIGVSKKAREIIDITKKAEEYLNRNVSIMHISSLLCAFPEPLD